MQAGDAAQQRRFAAAGGTDQRQQLARRALERGVERDRRVLTQLHLEAGSAHCSFFPMRWVRNWISTIEAKQNATSTADSRPAARSSKACTWS